jgi:hypothetical protein
MTGDTEYPSHDLGCDEKRRSAVVADTINPVFVIVTPLFSGRGFLRPVARAWLGYAHLGKISPRRLLVSAVIYAKKRLRNFLETFHELLRSKAR